MKMHMKLAIATVGVIIAAWLIYSWFEAEKEIRVLCSVFHSGQDIESVIATLNTGEYLQYELQPSDSGQTIYVDSYYNLGTSSCAIEFSEKTAISSVLNE